MHAERIDQLIDDQPDKDCALIDCDDSCYDYGALRRIVADFADELSRHG